MGANAYTDEIYSDLLLSSREQAISYLFVKYHNKIYQYALKATKSEAVAEDILQDVFIKLFEYRELPALGNVESFMMAVTRNHTLNILKRRKFELKQYQQKYWDESQHDTEDTIYRNDSRQILQRAVQLLPARQRDVFVLCLMKGLKYKEAAKLLSLSPLTVKKHLQLAKQFMRSYVSKNDLFILLSAVLPHFLGKM